MLSRIIHPLGSISSKGSKADLEDLEDLSLLCRRADGAGAVVIVSEEFWQQVAKRQNFLETRVCIQIAGTGEASGPSFPPAIKHMDEGTFDSCRQAVNLAAFDSGIKPDQLYREVWMIICMDSMEYVCDDQIHLVHKVDPILMLCRLITGVCMIAFQSA